MPVDVDKFTAHLRQQAKATGQHACAKRVREALQAGGAKIAQPWPGDAKDWGPSLLSIGFHEMAVENLETFNIMKGDVMVMQPYQGGNPAGHMAGYDGRNWISDFLQNDFWSGPGYRKEKPSYVIYRP